MHGLVLVDVYCLTNVYSNMCNDSSKPINSKKKKLKKKTQFMVKGFSAPPPYSIKFNLYN